MAYTRPSACSTYFIPLLSQRNNMKPSWKSREPINWSDGVLLVPKHLDRIRDKSFALVIEAAQLTVMVVDVWDQAVWMLGIPGVGGRLADDKDDDLDATWVRERYFTFPMIRTVAYVLYFLEYVYRYSVTSQWFANWAGTRSSKSLSRTYNGYQFIRGTTSTAICSMLLYSIIRAQDVAVSNNVFELFFRFWPVVPMVCILHSLTVNLLLSSKHLAKWIYRYTKKTSVMSHFDSRLIVGANWSNRRR
jgi:hypothetical protein